MNDIKIKEVQNKADLKAFVKFPFKLYRGNEFWVPPMIADELEDFNPKKNPAFEYSLLRQWLAFENDEIVGRIAGVLHEKEFEESKKIRFGWIDFIDKEEVSKILLEQVENWGKELGAEVIHGPMGFNDFDFEGMLVEGFDSIATIATIYNYPYYKLHLEKFGYVKAVDWLEFINEVPQIVDDKFSRVSSMIEKRYSFRPIEITTKKQILNYSDAFFEVVNKSYSSLYGFYPLTDKEAVRIKKNYFSFLNPKFIKGIEDEMGNLVAFGITMPSLSKAYQKANGRLFPFGFIHLLKALNYNKVIDMYLIGSLPDKQNSGAVSMVYNELWKTYIKEGVTHLRSNPILETNHKLLNIWKSIYGKDFLEKAQLKRRRSYAKQLSNNE